MTEKIKKKVFTPRAGTMFVREKLVKRRPSPIIIPDTNAKKFDSLADIFDEHPWQVEVVLVGPQFKDDPWGYQVGDILYINNVLSQPVLINKEDLFVCRSSDVLCRVSEE